MNNDKKIAFTELSVQHFPGKFVTIIQHSKPVLWPLESDTGRRYNDRLGCLWKPKNVCYNVTENILIPLFSTRFFAETRLGVILPIDVRMFFF